MLAMTIPISAIVLTKNEEANLPDCLATLAWADERLVVDSFSTDATVDAAASLGARVVRHRFVDYASQRNFAQSQAAHNWVFFVDADERVTAELRDEIRGLAASGRLDDANAYHIARVHLILGQWFPDLSKRRVTPKQRAAIRRGEVARLFDRRQAVWERPLHEVVHVPEPHGVLDGALLHYANTNLSRVYAPLNDYTDREAAHLFRTSPRRVSVLEAALRGLRTFLYVYFAWHWWRHGEAGLLMAINLGFAKFLNYAKLGELARIAADDGVWTPADRALLPPSESAQANTHPSEPRHER
jgi:glycosyltransferase involved in cell wall biosynthesis